jgi:hypothetical protein
MSLFLDIAQGSGLASATGVRPFLPPLLTGALARGDLGVDFDGTDYSFLESPAFLVVVLALAVGSYALERSRAERAPGKDTGVGAATGERRGSRRDPVAIGTAVVAVALGALLFAGSLADGGEEAWPGLLGGAACALLAFVAVTGLVDRARSRLDRDAATLLPAWADLAALALAAIAVLFPPAALVGIAALVYLLVATRRSTGQKYEGLRILR